MMTATSMRTLLLLALLLGGLVAPAAAQDAPLRKSDIVRMLSGSTYSVDEVATIVRSNCLSFAPTERDLSDFRELGANDAVLTAVRDCAARGAAGDGDAQPEPAPTPVFEVEPVSALVSAPVDSTALVTVLVRRGGQLAGGVEIVLDGSGEISGAAELDRAGASGSDGRATIRVPTGDRVRRYPLTIRSPDGVLTGTTALTLEATPGPPARLASPRSPVVFRGGPLELPVEVTDEFGNPVSEVEVAVAGLPDGGVLARGATGADGRIGLTVAPESLRGVDRLVVSSADRTIGELALESDVQGTTMAFVAGTSQTGVPGEPLADPVTVEVYDVAGDPARGADVRFTATNGSVGSETVRTGTDGRASVRVIAGPDASRPVEVRARSGVAEALVSLPVLSREDVVAQALAQGQRRLEAGEADAAITSYRRAADLQPRNVEAWVGLGDALVAAGRTDRAREAYEEALDVEPGNTRAADALSELGLGRTVFGADVWGGTTVDGDRDAGIRYAEVRINPAVSWLAVRGMFDDALNLRRPWLRRGSNDLREFAGAVDVRWGSARRLTTTFEVGRREQPAPEFTQNTYLLAQDVRLDNGGGLQFGGWVGRWFDRDDYVIFGEGRFPASRYVTIRPSVSYGDNAGSNVSMEDGTVATGRAPETEVRGGVKITLESPDGWGIEPGIAVGSVGSDLSDEFEGSLLDATTRLWARLGQVRFQGFVRYQSPPGSPSFWTVALGFGFDVRGR